MAKSFAEVIHDGLTPPDRLWLDIHALGIVTEVIECAPLDNAQILGTSTVNDTGIIQSVFNYVPENGVYLPAYEKRIQTEKWDGRERHVLNKDGGTTTSLARSGVTYQGGNHEVTVMARGLEQMLKIMLQEPAGHSWWIRPKVTTE
jgi:hypothetical protein